MRSALVPPPVHTGTRRIRQPREVRGALPASLNALRDTEQRVAEEIRLGTIEAGAARIALEHLRRARLVLRVAVKGPVRLADEPAVEVTMCWLCGEAIVPERLADPADVVRHMATCAHASPKPRRASTSSKSLRRGAR